MFQSFKTIEWKNDKVHLIDQRKLPLEESYVVCEDYQQIASAIKNMVVRGAPAIGVTAAMGVALGALGIDAKNFTDFFEKIEKICDVLDATRPTAVNLKWATERMKRFCQKNRHLPLSEIQQRLKMEAATILEEDIATNRQIGKWGAELLPPRATVLTHCNAGALATGGYGTALGIIYTAHEQGKIVEVFADETRPFLQGARLTAWELKKNHVPVRLITDNMAGFFMKKGGISCVVVGADRIAANGDVANKIGTYMVAVLAHRHDIPFYVAAPLSTIDIKTPDGPAIPIEERPIEEVINFGRQQVSPGDIKVSNPAFDVTPAELITAIVTEKGVVRAPFKENIQRIFDKKI
ncbi:MAG: S-methyl-5-thioribose-1-phosphate isomerase [Deltaproteobacteria bacterium RIFCSPLOWO2_02_FULL_50_16]|nr:MAG: S-methyl-5-thioribose-1-phosphate isomerase [Deltaproteobacteria bacterium GWA2_50_8]OGQ30493.1 MAG: S-methyl-5-thioribose-1-phosphate isomerase [Deltaproteobacteria bacterium RIFCSPHIGHO2_02_FULL_50_15]OGQ56385.1 MAG: S-methyl-5-thioribose-1-phosphate isomerase [Deltaproteobacteria bacterium RIFCSPLOWO2_02_FULL_50_16]